MQPPQLAQTFGTMNPSSSSFARNLYTLFCVPICFIMSSNPSSFLIPIEMR